MKQMMTDEEIRTAINRAWDIADGSRFGPMVCSQVQPGECSQPQMHTPCASLFSFLLMYFLNEKNKKNLSQLPSRKNLYDPAS